MKYRHNRSMKRLCTFLLFVFLCYYGFSSSNPFGILWDVGTSAILYGDSDVNSLNKTLANESYTRVIVSGDLGTSISLDERLQFVLGGTTVMDSHINGKQNVIYLDYAFFGGVKVYPNLGGLNIGLEYVTGRRTDFFHLADLNINEISSTMWGNGFRFATQYDFSYHTKTIGPVIGMSWRRMPRGGSSDNIFSFYFSLAF